MAPKRKKRVRTDGDGGKEKKAQEEGGLEQQSIGFKSHLVTAQSTPLSDTKTAQKENEPLNLFGFDELMDTPGVRLSPVRPARPSRYTPGDDSFSLIIPKLILDEHSDGEDGGACGGCSMDERTKKQHHRTELSDSAAQGGRGRRVVFSDLVAMPPPPPTKRQARKRRRKVTLDFCLGVLDPSCKVSNKRQKGQPCV